MGLFDKLKQGLQRTTQQLRDRFEDIVRIADTGDARTREIDVDTAESLEEILLMADVGVAATREIVAAVRRRQRRGESLRELVKQEMLRVLEVSVSAAAPDVQGAAARQPRVILVVGVNGVGKTTTIGKIAYMQTTQGKKVLLCAADTFRAAAIEQLEIWGQRTGVDIVRQSAGSDPSAVLFDALQAAKARGVDTVLIDTAGRLHTKSNLMAELEKMRRTAARVVPDAPHEVLLVMDATTGQNGLEQARRFTESSGVTGIVLTKLDGTAKGGVVVAIARELNLPIRYIGVGEQAADLLPFEAERFIESLFA
jgi:fused signal recognition particle receptor